MSGEETRRVCAEVRDARLELIGEPCIPPWLGQGLGLLGEVGEREGEAVGGAALFPRAVRARFEAAGLLGAGGVMASVESDPGWRAAALDRTHSP